MPGPGVGDRQPDRPRRAASQLDLQPPAAGMASRALRSRLTSTVPSWPASDDAVTGAGGPAVEPCTPCWLGPRRGPARRAWPTTRRRSQRLGAAAAGGRAKSRRSCTVCSRRDDLAVDDAQVLAGRAAVRFAGRRAASTSILIAGERVADLVGDAGGELADRGQLLGPQQLLLLPLQPLGRLLDPADDVLHLPVQVWRSPSAATADGGHVLVEVLGHVLDADAQAGRSTGSARGRRRSR